MKNTNEKNSEKLNKEAEKKGLFTEKMPWWQVLLGLILVGYLVYGKIQESIIANNPPVSSSSSTQ